MQSYGEKLFSNLLKVRIEMPIIVISVVQYSTCYNKNLIAKSKIFPGRNIHKFMRPSSNGMSVIRLITHLEIGVGIQVHLLSSLSGDLTIVLITV